LYYHYITADFNHRRGKELQAARFVCFCLSRRVVANSASPDLFGQ
jgi:hypothetical protein